MSKPSEPRIIVALDFPEQKKALDFITRIEPGYCRLKVGKELFTSAGPSLVEKLVADGFDVFLDFVFTVKVRDMGIEVGVGYRAIDQVPDTGLFCGIRQRNALPGFCLDAVFKWTAHQVKSIDTLKCSLDAHGIVHVCGYKLDTQPLQCFCLRRFKTTRNSTYLMSPLQKGPCHGAALIARRT